MNNQRVVVVCTGFHPSIGLIRTLGRASYRPECYVYGEYADVVVKSRYVSKSKVFETAEEVVEYLLETYPVCEDKPVLITSGDYSQCLVDKNLEAFEKKFVVFNAGAPGKVTFWMDKQNIGELAKKHGLNVPWMLRLRRGDAIPSDIDFPVFTKSGKTADGGKQDERVCRNMNELSAATEKMTADEYLVMPFIDKIREVNYFGVAAKGKVYIDYVGVDVRPPEGSYGCYNHFSPCPEDSLHSKLVSLIKDTGYEGLFEIEFLEGKDGELYFTEVNFRADGGLYQLSYGINLPAAWCQISRMSAGELPEHLEMSGKSYYGMTEIYDFRQSVSTGRVNFFLWLWQLLGAKRHTFFYWKDLKPTICQALRFLK